MNIELFKQRSQDGWIDARLCRAEELPHGTWFETISGQMLRRLGWWQYTASRILDTRTESGSPDLIRGMSMVLPYEFEDQIEGDITPERFAESRIVCGVRMYPKGGDAK